MTTCQRNANDIRPHRAPVITNRVRRHAKKRDVVKKCHKFHILTQLYDLYRTVSNIALDILAILALLTAVNMGAKLQFGGTSPNSTRLTPVATATLPKFHKNPCKTF